MMIHINLKSTEVTPGEPNPIEKDELIEQELDRVAGGGEAITFKYGALEVQYVQQTATGSSQ
jgi:hypothetical protein